MKRTFVMTICCVLCMANAVLAEDVKKEMTESTPAPAKPGKESFADYQAVTTVNIFIRRKPVSKNSHTENNNTSTAVTPPPPPVNTYLLCGIIIENDDRVTAMIEDSQTHTLRSVHVGDKLDVFEIPAMTISSVHLNLPGGRTVELFIGQTIDAHGVIQQTGWTPTSNSATPETPDSSGTSGSAAPSNEPASEKELSILEKLRRKRESQLK